MGSSGGDAGGLLAGDTTVAGDCPYSNDPTQPGAQNMSKCDLQADNGNTGSDTAKHTQHYHLIPPEQMAMQKGTRECYDALVTDDAISREAKADKRTLSMVWLDFKEALVTDDAISREAKADKRTLSMVWLEAYDRAPQGRIQGVG